MQNTREYEYEYAVRRRAFISLGIDNFSRFSRKHLEILNESLGSMVYDGLNYDDILLLQRTPSIDRLERWADSILYDCEGYLQVVMEHKEYYQISYEEILIIRNIIENKEGFKFENAINRSKESENIKAIILESRSNNLFNKNGLFFTSTAPGIEPKHNSILKCLDDTYSALTFVGGVKEHPMPALKLHCDNDAGVYHNKESSACTPRRYSMNNL